MTKSLLTLFISLAAGAFAYCQNPIQTDQIRSESTRLTNQYTVSTTYLSLVNFGEEKTNTHHYELHVGYRINPKAKIGIKLATWSLFAPMGMPMQEQLKYDEDNFYPGRLRETGIGITYQRLLWKELFVTTEILPQLETYLDEDNHKLGNGFKLYTSYHLGYHLSFWGDRLYLEPQIHCQYWPIQTNVPQSFEDKDKEWKNYFLFEPNLYLGTSLKF